MFDRVVIINLDRRPDRWLRIGANLAQIDWPFAEPVRVAAHDGRQDPPPACFAHTPGAWGCLMSHLKVCNQAIRDGIESLLIFEDDGFFPLDFELRARRFLDAVPDDWESLYLGGYHYLPAGWPRPIDGEVLQGRCVLGTWAYALRGRAIRALGRALEQAPQAIAEDRFGVDRLWGVLHRDRIIKVYTPWQWAVHHGGGRSDTNGRQYRTHDFRLPEIVSHALRQQVPEEAMT
jgi:hypothetical protein